MADLTITSVSLVSGAVESLGTLSEGVSPGDVLYIDPSTRQYTKADASAQETADIAAVSLITGITDGIAVVAKSGAIIDVGAILNKGSTYVLSENAGKIKIVGNLVATEFVSLVGVALSTSQLQLSFVNSGITFT